MPLAYVKPGVSVNELVNPSFSPISADETTICLIGVGAGYQQKSEIVQLLDNTPVELSVDNGIDLGNLVVRDYDDRSIIYVRGVAGPPATGDYFISGSSIARSMATQIGNGERILIQGTHTAGAFSEFVTLNDAGADGSVNLTTAAANGTDFITNFTAQRLGKEPFAQGAGASPSNTNGIWVRTDASPVTLRVVATGSGPFVSGSKHRVYLDYVDVTGQAQQGIALDLNGTTPVAYNATTPAAPAPAVQLDGTIAGLVIRNVNDPTYQDPVVGFSPTSDSNAITSPGSGNDIKVTLSGTTYAAYRPDTTSDIESGQTVLVEYTATPEEYYLPTRCFSMADVEDKYGPGLAGNSDPDGFAAGAVKSPLSFAAQLAFGNGANSVVIQPLYSEVTVNGKVVRAPSTDPGTIAHWDTTLTGLRNIEDVNMIVPLISTNGVGSDSLSILVFQHIQNHIDFMADQQYQYIIGMFGEDSTIAGQASTQVLRTHAKTLGGRTGSHPEAICLISPGAFKVANPVTGLPSSVGGQYVAAALAGSIAASATAATMTRHVLGGVVDIIDGRTEGEKDADARAGLTVIENRRNTIQVRHAITTAVNDSSTRELSVIRAKHFMIESIRTTLDEQVIGQVVIDERAAFTVQLLVEATLEEMVTQGVIATYDGTTATVSNLEPTTITVRFSYLPLFPLNYVNIQFSIDTSSSVIQVADTGAQING